MAENPSGPTKPLDVQRLHSLVRLMKRYDLTALDITDGSVQIRLRRSAPQCRRRQLVLRTRGRGRPESRHKPPRRVLDPSRRRRAAAAPRTIVIESPMVGTYFASSAPDSPTFVAVGSVVQLDTIVCIIEAMKVFTDIPAGVSGTIAAILVKNGQAVEFGQPLFRVIPT